jgi:hypothetical protein
MDHRVLEMFVHKDGHDAHLHKKLIWQGLHHILVISELLYELRLVLLRNIFHETVCLMTLSRSNQVRRVVGHVGSTDMKPCFTSKEHVYNAGDLCFRQVPAFGFAAVPATLQVAERLEYLTMESSRDCQRPSTSVGVPPAVGMRKRPGLINVYEHDGLTANCRLNQFKETQKTGSVTALKIKPAN